MPVLKDLRAFADRQQDAGRELGDEEPARLRTLTDYTFQYRRSAGTDRRRHRRCYHGDHHRRWDGSDAKAVLTLRELQRWLALPVACYHGQVHETPGRTPAAVWADKAAEAGAQVTTGTDNDRRQSSSRARGSNLIRTC